jgi:hypothetical protein
MELFGMVKIINLLPDDFERNDFLEEKKVFSPESDGQSNAVEVCLTWEEFNKSIIENSCRFDNHEMKLNTDAVDEAVTADSEMITKRPIKYLLMIDNIDVFDTMGKNYYSIHHKYHPINLISHCLNMVNSVQSPSQASSIPVNMYSPASEENDSMNEKKGNIIASLIVYGRRPSEIQLQLPNMTFHSSASSSLPYVVNSLNDRYCNGPFLQDEQQPLLSEYLKYR